ncbi:MAG: DUF2839 domain-containing protein [Acaryochloridaceae cyanobacterium SU_2_1]|nr:DUF2839 domain-containing protein [Acaryochloridaceae cyanobacterium SU_2_1]NJM95329.1 DUF2839 domain-containing protein [Acaryochloridaceae cyanobacterium CSU_5_19]
MGEAKRRQAALGEDYGKEPNMTSWLPVTKQQLQKLYDLVMKGSWVAIALLILSWIVIRFVGPYFGWWGTVDAEGL